jgi:hypothetical protein
MIDTLKFLLRYSNSFNFGKNKTFSIPYAFNFPKFQKLYFSKRYKVLKILELFLIILLVETNTLKLKVCKALKYLTT